MGAEDEEAELMERGCPPLELSDYWVHNREGGGDFEGNERPAGAANDADSEDDDDDDIKDDDDEAPAVNFSQRMRTTEEIMKRPRVPPRTLEPAAVDDSPPAVAPFVPVPHEGDPVFQVVPGSGPGVPGRGAPGSFSETQVPTSGGPNSPTDWPALGFSAIQVDGEPAVVEDLAGDTGEYLSVDFGFETDEQPGDASKGASRAFQPLLPLAALQPVGDVAPQKGWLQSPRVRSVFEEWGAWAPSAGRSDVVGGGNDVSSARGSDPMSTVVQQPAHPLRSALPSAEEWPLFPIRPPRPSAADAPAHPAPFAPLPPADAALIAKHLLASGPAGGVGDDAFAALAAAAGADATEYYAAADARAERSGPLGGSPEAVFGELLVFNEIKRGIAAGALEWLPELDQTWEVGTCCPHFIRC